MTADKDLKRLVRARSLNTGESYAVARRRLLERPPGGSMNPATLKPVDKSDLGFVVWVPETWTEFPPLPSNSPYEVARFRYRDEGRHICLVFRQSGQPGLTPQASADGARHTLERKGFDNFTIEDLTLDGRSTVRMDFDTTRFDFGPWFVREYFWIAGDVRYTLGLGTSRPNIDRALYDEMAQRFQLI